MYPACECLSQVVTKGMSQRVVEMKKDGQDEGSASSLYSPHRLVATE